MKHGGKNKVSFDESKKGGRFIRELIILKRYKK